jgi:hypothetical protein
MGRGMKNHYKVFLWLLLLVNSIEAHRFVNIYSPDIKLLKTREMRFCNISFVLIDGTVYIVKQKNNIRKILGCVRDAITAYIAESLDIAHRVVIVPAGMKFPGKMRDDWPATIHTIAPGKMIKEQKEIFRKMNLQQKEEGFRRDMLRWMARYPLLVYIVALDIFTCNHDRHRGNLFFNPRTKLFCAIDMDSSYKYNLCALACENFTALIEDGLYPLTSAEFNALAQLRKTLVFLIKTYPPEKVVARYNEFAHQAGFIPDSPLYTEKIHMWLEANKEMIVQSYQDVQRLVKILNKAIRRGTKSS